jgi:hypothetical protein
MQETEPRNTRQKREHAPVQRRDASLARSSARRCSATLTGSHAPCCASSASNAASSVRSSAISASAARRWTWRRGSERTQTQGRGGDADAVAARGALVGDGLGELGFLGALGVPRLLGGLESVLYLSSAYMRVRKTHANDADEDPTHKCAAVRRIAPEDFASKIRTGVHRDGQDEERVRLDAPTLSV